MSAIRVENVHKTYANGFAAVRGVDLSAEDGEFLVLVGPSGCGKTTLLRMIAGLESISSGRIVIGDEDVTNVPPQARDVAMVFQDYALYPHMTVAGNLAVGLRLSRTTVYVPHDQVEAMTLGHRVAVMRDGALQQLDTPQKLYQHPVNVFVAAFIGSPAMNLVEAHVERGTVYVGELSIPLPTDMHTAHRGDVVLGIRPTDFELVATADPDLPRVTVRPEVVEDLGAELQLIFAVSAPHPRPGLTQAGAAGSSIQDGRW